MPSFGRISKERLLTCKPDLQKVFDRVVEIMDCSVVEGFRGQEKQDEYFVKGKSRVKYPHGKHNKYPSEAVDVAPWIRGEISWDYRHCIYLAGIVLGVAEMMGIKIRWGGDWDMDREPIADQDFQDLVHYELVY